MNLASVLILIVVLAAVAAALWGWFRSGRKSSCGCGCEGCAMKDSCHQK